MVPMVPFVMFIFHLLAPCLVGNLQRKLSAPRCNLFWAGCPPPFLFYLWEILMPELAPYSLVAVWACQLLGAPLIPLYVPEEYGLGTCVLP